MRGEEVTGRNGEIMQRRGTRSPGAASRVGRLQSAQRRTSCFSVVGPNISLCKALHFGSAATPMSLWIVNIMNGRWGPKSGNYCRVSGEMRSLLCEVTRNARSGWLGGGTPAAGPGSDITTRHRYTGSRDIASIDITWRHPVLNRQTWDHTDGRVKLSPELLSTHCLVWIVGVRDMAVLTFDGLATPGHCSTPGWVAVQAAGQRTHRLQLSAHKWWGNVSSWALGWDDLTRDLASRRPVSGVGELFRLDAKLRINLCFTAVNIGVSADSAVH